MSTGQNQSPGVTPVSVPTSPQSPANPTSLNPTHVNEESLAPAPRLVSAISPAGPAITATSPTHATTTVTATATTILTPEKKDISETLQTIDQSGNIVQEGKDGVTSVSNLQDETDAPVSSIKSQPGVRFTPVDDLEAAFTGVSNKNTDPISMVLPDNSEIPNVEATSKSKANDSKGGVINVALNMLGQGGSASKSEAPSVKASVKSSPLLSSTPPTVSKALIRAYPFLILSLRLLNILTWNEGSQHLSIFLVLTTVFSILYYEPMIIYLGHLLPVFAIWVYSECKNFVKSEQVEYSTLDDIIQTITLVTQRADILISPIVELDLTAGDLKRLLFTTVFLSPIYVVISFFILPPNKMILALAILVLTYHSKWSKVTRNLLWKSRTFRLLCFYLTGLDFENSGLSKSSTLFNLNKKLSSRFARGANGATDGAGSKSSVRFTYVIYENQRRWLGVGWTPNLLSYERTPWTDEFLNESEPIDSFELPQLPLSIDVQDYDNTTIGGSGKETEEVINAKGMVWRWIDKTWRLDLTNDGAIQLPSTKAKTTANPKSDDGWIYYDNTWKNPTTEDGFSKYTRRRRWIRTAELVYINKDGKGIAVKTDVSISSKGAKNVKIADSATSSKSNEKSVNFSDEAVYGDPEADNLSVSSTGEKKVRRGGMKKTVETGEVKKRKSLRFDDTTDAI